MKNEFPSPSGPARRLPHEPPAGSKMPAVAGRIKLIIWILSIALPVGMLVVFLVFRVLLDPNPLDAEWLWWIPINMTLLFSGVWGVYFFLSWSLAKPDSDRHNCGGAAVASFALGITGLLTWFIPFVGFSLMIAGPITVVGLFLGIKGMKSPKRTMAILGVILCVVGLVLTIMHETLRATSHGHLFQ